MTIAVSALVRPSRVALGMSAAACIGSVLIGGLIGGGMLHDLSCAARIAAASIAILAGLAGFHRLFKNRKAHHIDISGIGQIRLVEYSALATSTFDVPRPMDRIDGEVVSLMDDSTLWPFLLILRLKTADQRIKVVIVMPDSVPVDGFRALAVACRWIAAHNNPA